MMRVILVAGTLALAATSALHAQDAPEKKKPRGLLDCHALGDQVKAAREANDARKLADAEKSQLDCFNEYAEPLLDKARKDLAQAEKDRIRDQTAFIRKWKLRDASSISPSGDYDIGSKPATVQIGSSDGNSISTVKGAVFGILQPIRSGALETWEPFFSLGWDRDISAKTPRDVRQVAAGISGNALTGSYSSTVQFYTTLRMGHRNDIAGNTRGTFVNANSDFYYLPWVAGKRGEEINYWGIYFPVGVFSERTSSASTVPGTDGLRHSIYAGVRFQADLHAVLPRLSANASTLWFNDFKAPQGASMRHTHYSTVGLTYDLVDPKAKKGWVPSLSLSREVGSNPLTGEGPVNKTVLGLGVKFD